MSAPLVVTKRYGSEDGGRVGPWSGTPEQLQAAIAAGQVAMFDPDACPNPPRCRLCGDLFVSARAARSHQLRGRQCRPVATRPVVVGNRSAFVDGASRSGGETWTWAGSTGSLDVAVANGDVEAYRSWTASSAIPCPACGATFVTAQARDAHHQHAHAGASSVMT